MRPTPACRRCKTQPPKPGFKSCWACLDLKSEKRKEALKLRLEASSNNEAKAK